MAGPRRPRESGHGASLTKKRSESCDHQAGRRRRRRRRVNAVVQHVDIVPTVLDLAKPRCTTGSAAARLKPLLEGAAEFPARVVYSESFFNAYRFGWSRVRSVTDGRYRLVRSEQDELRPRQRSGRRANIATEHPAELNRLRAALDQIVADDHVAEPTPQPGDVTENSPPSIRW